MVYTAGASTPGVPMYSMGYVTPGVNGGPPIPVQNINAGGDGDCGFSCGSAGGGAGGACGTAGCGVGADDATVMSHVGPGAGDYRLKTYYEYIGGGLGDHDAVRVPTNVRGSYATVWVVICLVLPVLLLLLHTFSSQGGPPPSPTPAPAPPAQTPPPPTRTCTWWGDPHYWTFDDPQRTHEEDEYNTARDYWIIKTPVIWIQGRYRPTQWLIKRGNHRACMHGVAFGGPWMNNNKFIVEALNGGINYNGLSVMNTFPSSFSQGPVTAKYHNEGLPNDPRMGKMKLHIVDITLPLGVTVQVDRWKEHIDGKITMNQVEAMKGSMTGHCGNFNGNSQDDVSKTLDKWGGHYSLTNDGVSAEHLLFPPSNFHDDKLRPLPSGQSPIGE